MGLGAVLEPLVVVSLLATGTIVNRNTCRPTDTVPRLPSSRPAPWEYLKYDDDSEDTDVEAARTDNDSKDALLPKTLSRSSSSSGSIQTVTNGVDSKPVSRYRTRTLRFLSREKTVTTPNTEVFKNRLLSRLLQRFPFLVEVWYWALIYWVCSLPLFPLNSCLNLGIAANVSLLTLTKVYQLGRAFTAVMLQAETVDTARKHALQVIHVEQWLGIFVEPAVQEWFLQHPNLMRWTNRAYSFIHIPGTILFLVVLYHVTTAQPRRRLQEEHGDLNRLGNWRELARPFGPDVYEKRRRTMAMCNLLAFIVFTFWPCMPPRLLSDPEYTGPDAKEAKSFGFVDTVHGADGDSSVWTTNRFCNQYGECLSRVPFPGRQVHRLDIPC
jgi:hypothetical protein